MSISPEVRQRGNLLASWSLMLDLLIPSQVRFCQGAEESYVASRYCLPLHGSLYSECFDVCGCPSGCPFGDYSRQRQLKRFYLRSPDKGEFARAILSVFPH